MPRQQDSLEAAIKRGRILAAYWAGEKTTAIAAKHGVDKTVPRTLARRAGLKPRGRNGLGT